MEILNFFLDFLNSAPVILGSRSQNIWQIGLEFCIMKEERKITVSLRCFPVPQAVGSNSNYQRSP